MSESPRLARRLGLGDAVVIGLGSMIGAGVFAAFTPAAAAAGSGLLVGLALAAAVAWANATSSAQLAAQYPESGGTYVYGRERLGAPWGFAAGWAFVVGKTASCAAMAMTAATYALGGAARATQVLGMLLVAGLTLVLLRGITRTARLARLLLSVTVLALSVTLLAILVATRDWQPPLAEVGSASAYGIAQSAGLLFFAFAGYARVATLGEEVREPQRTIPRAITRALGLVIILYAAVALTLLATIGADRVAGSALPLAEAARAAGVGWTAVPLRIGATVAALGALLGLLSGVSRTVLAMARRGDLPRPLATVEPAAQVPRTAQLAVGVAVVALLLVADLRHAIGFSSFGVLLYYAIANAAAWTQPPEYRRLPRWVSATGLVGCVLLALTLPIGSVLVGALVIAAGLVGRRMAGAA
jgi:APA family basic amino acid/polyamine antiporter